MWKNSQTHSNINVRHWVVMCVSIYINKWNMQCLNSGFNKFKMDDPIHVKRFIVQKLWKFVKYWIVYVLVYYNKCNMQFVNNGFNVLNTNGSI
jgi:hypothetical protein